MKTRSREEEDAPSLRVSKDLLLSSYDYALPPERIAKFPLKERDASKLLVLHRETGRLEHTVFSELPRFLNPGDVVVLNNTQVLPVRLMGHRQGYEGRVEILALHPVSPEAPFTWTALMKPSRKLTPGTTIVFPNTLSTLTVVEQGLGTRGTVQFHLHGEHKTVQDFLATIGEMPIPPYLKRPVTDSDKITYQTVYAKAHECLPGSQAAPTAGLHFTERTLNQLHQKGVIVTEVTLSVSTGTFRSVTSEDIRDHPMDPEAYHVNPKTAQAIMEAKQSGNRILAIGTTSLKTLETVATKFNGKLQSDAGWSELFIYPGFAFQIGNSLLTNFHLPKTTLLMLISAFLNRKDILNAYDEAIRQEYRFFSYGDCMLIL